VSLFVTNKAVRIQSNHVNYESVTTTLRKKSIPIPEISITNKRRGTMISFDPFLLTNIKDNLSIQEDEDNNYTSVIDPIFYNQRRRSSIQYGAMVNSINTKKPSKEFHVASDITERMKLVKNRGIKGLYHGLDAALTRQVFYTTTRLGIYNKMFNDWK
jgi:hypothetical protein